MSIRLMDTAPNFQAETTDGPIDFYEWLGDSWGVLFSHPGAFTPVCTTELGTVARLKPEFDRRNVKVIGISVDRLSSYREWVGDIEATQHVTMNFPLIADPDGEIANLYDMFHPHAEASTTVRSVFIIDPHKLVRLMIVYPAAVGRNFAEILRVIDALQLVDEYHVVTPADWKPGGDVIVGLSVSDADAERRFPKGVTRVRPYYRVTPQPGR